MTRLEGTSAVETSFQGTTKPHGVRHAVDNEQGCQDEAHHAGTVAFADVSAGRKAETSG